MRSPGPAVGSIARVTAALAAGLTISLIAACGDPHGRAGRDAGRDESGFSVYDLGSPWRDQRADTRTLASLKGRPQVLALAYTNCTSACPLTVAAMQQVEARAGGDAGFTLVSLDPGRDTPVRLAEYAVQHRLSSRWTLLGGDERAVRELAATIGVKYRRTSPTEIVHSTTLTILDADGRLVAQYGETDAVDRAVAALQRLAHGGTRGH